EDRATAGEHADHVELRCLANARQRANAAEESAREHAARTVDAREQRRDHRLRLARAAGELRVWREGAGVEPLVVRDRTHDVGRIFGPARQTEIDLRDRAVSVAVQERRELLLELEG